MPHTATNLLVHFIFSTKQRCALIRPDFEKDLHAYLGGIIRQIGGTALSVNGTRDHMHLLVRVSANRSVADVARLIKTEFLAVGAWTLARTSSFRLANWVWCIYRQRVGCHSGSGLYFKPGGTSQGEVISRRVSGVFEEEQNYGG
jgi:REP element-mobilizing transposase RayT